MHRYYIPCDLNNKIMLIDGDEAHHMLTVKRLKKGDIFLLFNGEGFECTAEIIDIIYDPKTQRKKARISINDVKEVSKEIDVNITLAFSVPKGKRAEFIIQKCAELGVRKVVPIISTRSIIRSNFEKKIEKWGKISIEASKQCGRNLIMEICDVLPFGSLEKLINDNQISLIFSNENESQGLKRILEQNKKVSNILSIVGPEGGFSHTEISKAKEIGCKVAKLTPQILRVETAIIAITAMLIYEYTF